MSERLGKGRLEWAGKGQAGVGWAPCAERPGVGLGSLEVRVSVYMERQCCLVTLPGSAWWGHWGRCESPPCCHSGFCLSVPASAEWGAAPWLLSPPLLPLRR